MSAATVVPLPVPPRDAVQPPRPAIPRIHESERRRFLRDRLELVSRTLKIVEWDLRLLRKAAVEAVCLVDQDPDAFADPSLRELMDGYGRALDALAPADARCGAGDSIRAPAIAPFLPDSAVYARPGHAPSSRGRGRGGRRREAGTCDRETLPCDGRSSA